MLRTSSFLASEAALPFRYQRLRLGLGGRDPLFRRRNPDVPRLQLVVAALEHLQLLLENVLPLLETALDPVDLLAAAAHLGLPRLAGFRQLFLAGNDQRGAERLGVTPRVREDAVGEGFGGRFGFRRVPPLHPTPDEEESEPNRRPRRANRDEERGKAEVRCHITTPAVARPE
jgi:hypothetical protein